MSEIKKITMKIEKLKALKTELNICLKLVEDEIFDLENVKLILENNK